MRQELLSIHLAVEVLSELSTSYDAHLQEHDRAAQFGGYVPLDDDLPVEVPLRLLRLAQSSISKEPVSAISFKDKGDFISRKSRFEIDECLVTVCGSNASTVARNIAQAYLGQTPPPVERELRPMSAARPYAVRFSSDEMDLVLTTLWQCEDDYRSSRHQAKASGNHDSVQLCDHKIAAIRNLKARMFRAKAPVAKAEVSNA